MKPIEVLGNAHILTPLREAIVSGAFSGCYLIEGPEGSGKKTIAGYLCALIACEKPKDGAPCFSCRGCENVFSHTHPDLFSIVPEEKAAGISVAVVREANRAAASAPMSAKKRVFLIPEAEKLGVEAQNALLKNLEEPASQAVYLLLATSSSVLLPTVLSRAVRFRTESLDEQTIFDALRARFPSSLPKEQTLASRICGGALGTAIRFLEDPDFRARRETAARYLDLLIENADFARFCALLPPDTKREHLRLVYPLLLDALRDALLVRTAGVSAPDAIFFTAADAPRLSRVRPEKLLALADQICRFLDPSMQNAYAAGSVSLLNALAAK